MHTQTMRQFRWFWAWEDEQEEAWLRQRSREGWHLRSVVPLGRYTFEAGEPRDYVYRLDFHTGGKDYQTYLQLFRDAGWTHMGTYGSWQYFRIEARPGENPEIYTDPASKVTKYTRLMAVLVVFLPVYASLLSRSGRDGGLLSDIVTFVAFLLTLVYIYAMVMLLRRVGTLRRTRV